LTYNSTPTNQNKRRKDKQMDKNADKSKRRARRERRQCEGRIAYSDGT